MTKILIQNEFFGNSNLSNDLKLASQAYDEGSIPFTRSNEINELAPIRSTHERFCDKM